jgi:hypothetical protein
LKDGSHSLAHLAGYDGFLGRSGSAGDAAARLPQVQSHPQRGVGGQVHDDAGGGDEDAVAEHVGVRRDVHLGEELVRVPKVAVEFFARQGAALVAVQGEHGRGERRAEVRDVVQPPEHPRRVPPDDAEAEDGQQHAYRRPDEHGYLQTTNTTHAVLILQPNVPFTQMRIYGKKIYIRSNRRGIHFEIRCKIGNKNFKITL